MEPDKAALRKRYRKSRRDRPAGDRLRAKQQLSVLGFTIVVNHLDLVPSDEWGRRNGSGGPSRRMAVGAYSPIPGEPDIRGLLNRLIADGIDVYLPVSTPGRPLEWALDTGAFHAGSVGGGAEPVGEVISSADLVQRAGLVLVPALAVDERGVRLGQGGGYYDCSFAGAEVRPLSTFWSVLYDDEFADRLPDEPHDLRVDGVLTPSGLTRL